MVRLQKNTFMERKKGKTVDEKYRFIFTKNPSTQRVLFRSAAYFRYKSETILLKSLKDTQLLWSDS